MHHLHLFVGSGGATCRECRSDTLFCSATLHVGIVPEAPIQNAQCNADTPWGNKSTAGQWAIHTCNAYVPGATYAKSESLERAPATDPSTMVEDLVILSRCTSICLATSRTGSPLAAVAMSSSVFARSASTFQHASFMVWSPGAGLGWNREGHTNVRLPSSPARWCYALG